MQLYYNLKNGIIKKYKNESVIENVMNIVYG